MSDCLSALKLVERAWRAKHREEYAGSTRGAILEAICTASERLELAVFMYVPAAAHRGLAPNAIADAVAKAYTQAPHATPGVSAMMQEGIRRRRVVHEVLIRERERRTWEIWDARAFVAMREAMGWNIRRKLAGTQHGRALRNDCLGPEWELRRETRWEAVWHRTGARGRIQVGPARARAATNRWR